MRAPVSAPTPAQTPANAGLDLSCGNPAFGLTTGGVTFDQLVATFGAGNVVDTTGDDDEGFTYLRLFPKDPTRELALSIAPGEAAISEIWVESAASRARLAGVLGEGDGLAAVEAANGKPVQFYGFGKTGLAVHQSWDGGRLGEEAGCGYWVNTDGPRGLGGDPVNARSDDPAVRALDARVRRFGMRRLPPATP
jgi:hypothetical protein